MRVTKITVGRTYNSGSYTSHRFEMEAKLDRGEDVLQAHRILAHDLHVHALVTMADQGVPAISEPSGKVSIPRPDKARPYDDGDDIPY